MFEQLKEWFSERGHKVEFPLVSKEDTPSWRSGLCTADNLQHAEKMLKGFMCKKEGRQVKDVHSSGIQL